MYRQVQSFITPVNEALSVSGVAAHCEQGRSLVPPSPPSQQEQAPNTISPPLNMIWSWPPTFLITGNAMAISSGTIHVGVVQKIARTHACQTLKV